MNKSKLYFRVSFVRVVVQVLNILTLCLKLLSLIFEESISILESLKYG